MTVFSHDFSKDAAGFAPFAIARGPKAAIEMDFDDRNGFWLSANREGFEYLARVFAELAKRDLPAGHHFHCDGGFREVTLDSTGEVETVDGEPADEGASDRLFTFELVNPNFATETYGADQ